MVVLMGRKRGDMLLRGHRRKSTRRLGWGSARGFESGSHDWTTFMGELFRPRSGVSAFEEATLVAQLENIKKN